MGNDTERGLKYITENLEKKKKKKKKKNPQEKLHNSLWKSGHTNS